MSLTLDDGSVVVVYGIETVVISIEDNDGEYYGVYPL